MPILVDDLRSASGRVSKVATLSEARRLGFRTAFLCHSHKDSDLVKGTANWLNEGGWNIYVDWADASMPETPNGETARRIQGKIEELHYFLFLATANSMNSRWCPWELGYATGKKHHEEIFIIPTRQLSGQWHGSEYLQLYRQIDVASSGALGVWSPGQDRGVLLKNL